MAAQNAQQAVWNTAELLESVFILLPATDMIRLPILCRQFRDIIATSKPLRRKLMLIAPANPRVAEARRPPRPSGGNLVATNNYWYHITGAPVNLNPWFTIPHSVSLRDQRGSRYEIQPSYQVLRAMMQILHHQDPLPSCADMMICDAEMLQVEVFLTWEAGLKEGSTSFKIMASMDGELLTVRGAMQQVMARALYHTIRPGCKSTGGNRFPSERMITKLADIVKEVEGIESADAQFTGKSYFEVVGVPFSTDQQREDMEA